MINHGVTDISEYERLRLENIAKNNQFLSTIGIDSTAKVKTKLKSVVIKKQKEDVLPAEPTRRSSRVAELQSVDYTDHNVQLPKKQIVVTKLEVSVSEDLPVVTVSKTKRRRSESEVNVVTGSSNDSCSQLSADKHILLSKYLAAPVEQFGKAAVMALANRGVLPKFSKYSGVVEWNNAILLWVNIGGSTGFTNTFTEGGRFMQWYGGSKMHAESTVVQRLLIAGDRNRVNNQLSLQNRLKSADLDSVDDVLLLTREEGGNYLCLGRLAIAGKHLAVHPITIQWQLLDFDEIRDTEGFQSMLQLSGYRK